MKFENTLEFLWSIIFNKTTFIYSFKANLRLTVLQFDGRENQLIKF